MRTWTLLLAGILTLPACVASNRSYLDGPLMLRSVQRPADVAERWGEYQLSEADAGGYTYQDELLALTVVPVDGEFGLALQNRTQYSMRFVWDQASYVDHRGVSSRVVPSNARWIDMDQPRPPEVIPSGARAQIRLIPRMNAETSTQTIVGFYPRDATCDQVSAMTFRLLLPIEIQGVVNEYTLQLTGELAEMVTLGAGTPGIPSSRERNREPCSGGTAGGQR